MLGVNYKYINVRKHALDLLASAVAGSLTLPEQQGLGSLWYDKLSQLAEVYKNCSKIAN